MSLQASAGVPADSVEVMQDPAHMVLKLVCNLQVDMLEDAKSWCVCVRVHFIERV